MLSRATTSMPHASPVAPRPIAGGCRMEVDARPASRHASGWQDDATGVT